MSQSIEKFGIVAGWGMFPVQLAERLKAEGNEVYVVGIKQHANEQLRELADCYKELGVAKLGAQIRFFERHGVERIALAGKIFKNLILHTGMGWISHFPDLTCWRTFAKNFLTRTADARDDTLLGAIVDEFQKHNILVEPIQNVAQDLLANEGNLTRSRVPSRVLADVKFGWSIAREMGGLDIGQSITVKDQMVLGVEAIEGTDALIRRTGKLCPRGGFTLIKLAKPHQDMRFDVPTIGTGTIRGVAEQGGSTIIIEANRSIILEYDETIAEAKRLGVRLLSLTAPTQASTDATRLNPPLLRMPVNETCASVQNLRKSA